MSMQRKRGRCDVLTTSMSKRGHGRASACSDPSTHHTTYTHHSPLTMYHPVHDGDDRRSNDRRTAIMTALRRHIVNGDLRVWRKKEGRAWITYSTLRLDLLFVDRQTKKDHER